MRPRSSTLLRDLKAFAPDRRNSILFAGFQAGGTRGATLVAGADAVKIDGAYVPVRATVRQISNLCALADGDGLIAWMAPLRQAPRHAFITAKLAGAPKTPAAGMVFHASLGTLVAVGQALLTLRRSPLRTRLCACLCTGAG